MAFSQRSLCFWHRAGNFYTHSHFLTLSPGDRGCNYTAKM